LEGESVITSLVIDHLNRISRRTETCLPRTTDLSVR
jgi:hypothetical protein